PPLISADERRMHVRAYEHWISLLDGRSYPGIADLDAAAVGDFGPHSVLLDFSVDPANPQITFLGRALREEGGLGAHIETIADVPPRSLISRLTDHYDEILANRAPVGFEAEFVSHRAEPTLYRGILMPYSSDGEAIDFIYGVINWKLSHDKTLPADVVAALTTVFSGPAQPAENLSDWLTADPAEDTSDEVGADVDLEDLIEDARELAIEARDSEGRSRAALYRAIALTHDLGVAAAAEPERFAALLEAAGIGQQARAPMTPIVKLVFGADYDAKRITEYAAVLAHARRQCIAPGMLETWLENFGGGIKAIVAAERHERRPALKVDRAKSARARLRAAPAMAFVDLQDAGEEEFVLLVARRDADGRIAIVSRLGTGSPIVDQALRHAAG
ncbi:MAG: hypothetical protein JWR77_2147, partial [Rhizorhabdus sp.]|nr:hypothetical protein [Rhizorhabdus sp.]